LVFIVTVHVPMPAQALQLANVEFADAVAVSTTMVPLGKFAEQAKAGQLIPAGMLVTVPVPVPASVTVSVKFDVLVLNVAVTA
jgi:hypothetical protein